MGLSALLGAQSKCMIGSVFCDAVVNELHTRSADVTEHPTESGSDVADNYKKRPDGLSINGIISRTPIAVGFPAQSTINSITALITGVDPVQAAWAEFEKYMEDEIKIPVITGKQYYPNMVIVDLQDDRVTNDWMKFSMILKEIRTAYTLAVEATIAEVTDAATTTAQQAASEGQQAAAEAQSSILKAGLEALAGSFLG